MKHRTKLKAVLVLIIALTLACALFACTPYTGVAAEKFPIIDDENNEINKDKTTQEEAVDRTCDSMDNLLDYLDSDVVSDTGYYIGSDIVINTENGSAFILKLRANLYTYPYELKDENGNTILDADGNPLVDEEKLAIHNRLIKQNDIVLEWYDAMTNTMLIGFYYDGLNPNSADPGNNLYLNLQGSKRIFPDFGDSVLYQQMVRLITQFNLASVMGGAAGGTADDAVDTIRTLLTVAGTNYKQVINGDTTSIFYKSVSLSTVADDVTTYIQDFFSPFGDKIDPLTKKYLGFSFYTLGRTTITSMDSDMQYLIAPPSAETLNKEMLSGVVIDLSGRSRVPDKITNEVADVPFTSRISVDYSVRTSSNIVIDKADYKLYEYGSYEYVGDLFIPYLDLKMDALIRTDMTENNNKENKVFAQFRDKADDKLLIGGYYTNELTYIDVEGLQNLYGGIKLEDIGLPKAYKEGFNLAEILGWLFDTIDIYIVYAVDELLSPSDGSGYDNLTQTIMDNMWSTEKNDADPTSRNTINIRIDIELIRMILKETSENGTVYTNEQMIDIINQEFNIDLDEIAAILGVSVETLMETTYFTIQYDVDDYSIKLDVYSTESNPEGTLLLTLDVAPTHIGEKVRITFPSFDNFKPLQKIMTYSGYLEGQFIFASTEKVDLSELMGAFIGDLSGLNTPYILPEAASIYFTLYYDQYIREQILDNGRWTRSGRSALNLHFYTMVGNERQDLFRVYANDVAFDTASPIEELGYVWVDLTCVEGMPRLKIREDLFIESFYEYMGEDVTDDEAINAGLTKIIRALLEDSWPMFEPDVIRITTSNQSLKDFFKVDELIGTVSAQIGFVQRVKNIDELEVNFAMYSVGEFDNIRGESPYDIKLHETITVYFDYGSRVETRDMLVSYDPDSVFVVNGTMYYYPTIMGRFMGVTRDYTVTITGGARGRSKIDALREDSVVWEPLQDLPETAVATYGGDPNQIYPYRADYKFFGTYDQSIDLYVIQNEYGYDILYDLKKNAYIVGLGSNFKYDDIYKVLNTGDLIYYKQYTNTVDVTLLYDIKAGYSGYYTVVNRYYDTKIIYNYDKDFYIVKDSADMANARVEVGEDAAIYTLNRTMNGLDVRYEFETGLYSVINDTYVIIYNPENGYLLVEDEATVAAVSALYGGRTVAVDNSIDWLSVNAGAEEFDKFDFERKRWDDIVWTAMQWENMPLSGGLYLVNVVIGENMMATYSQIIKLKVTNRVVDTDKYVNINIDTGKVTAPVVNNTAPIKVDPYVYALLKADYYNNRGNVGASLFSEWFFREYIVTIQFTDIFHNENDTPDEIDNFDWQFDYENEYTIYRESDINNRVAEGSESVTYLHTNFKGQIVALAIHVQPRTIDYIKFENENKNEYTVDSLLEETYVIPQNPVVYFKETDDGGAAYTLDFTNYSGTASSIFKDMIWTPSAAFETGVGSKAPNARTSVIFWSDSKADNIKLNWGGAPVRPFLRKAAIDDDFGSVAPDETTSFIDIKNHVDPDGTWFDAEWLMKPVVKVKVLMPDKVVSELTFTDGTEYRFSNISAADNGYRGMIFIDPLNPDTYVIPSSVSVFFEASGSYGAYSKDYDVDWSGNSNVTLGPDGKYRYNAANTGERGYAVLNTYIGNDEIGKIELKLLAVKLSTVLVGAEYYENALGGEALCGSLSATNTEYRVDTFSRFIIPGAVKVRFNDFTLFGDISERMYNTRFNLTDPWSPGVTVNTSAAVGDGKSIDVPITFIVEDREIESIRFPLASEAIAKLAANGTNFVLSGYIVANDVVSGTALSPYEYFRYVLSEIEITFTEATSTRFPRTVTVKDAVESALEPIYAAFNTQNTGTNGSGNYTIYLGQGYGAYNMPVLVKDNTIDLFSGDNYSEIAVRPYGVNDGGVYPLYPDGYILADNITVSVDYATAGTRIFSNLESWVVGKPDNLPQEYDNDSDCTMTGFAAGDVLTVLSWETLIRGGYAWISTMLPDSSRYYIRLEIGGIAIGSAYSTPDSYDGMFKIVNGVITINDIYSVYPLNQNLTADNLPSVIATQNIEIPGIVWTLEADITSEYLSAINYNSEIDSKLLATARIMDETISLYLKVERCEIIGISYSDAADSTKDFVTQSDAFILDPYRNYGYEGQFTMPQYITIHFSNGNRHTINAEDTNNIPTYFYYSNRQTGYVALRGAIPYDYNGHTFEDVNSSSISVRFTMRDEQIYTFVINFADRTVESVSVLGYNGEYVKGSVTLDPYGAVRTVSNNVRIYFSDGSYIDYVTDGWTGDYEVKYDTYRRILQYQNGLFSLGSSLEFAGISTQPLNLNLYVLDRVADVWTLNGETDYLLGDSANPNAYYRYLDPFVGTAAMLPGFVTGTGMDAQAGAINVESIPIVWNFADSDVTTEGTIVRDSYGKYGRVITGYIGSREYGQPVTIRVYINRWEYDGIRRPQGDGYQIMSEDIRFFFSTLTDISAYSNYEIIIRSTAPFGGTLVSSHTNRLFFPEDVDINTLKASDYGILAEHQALFNNREYPYRLTWDSQAKALAKTSIEAAGRFYLGDSSGITKIYPAPTSYYQYERPNITSLDLGYGYGVENYAMFVVNPLNPIFNSDPTGNPYVSTAQAKGLLNQENNADLGEVEVHWLPTGQTSLNFSDTYLKGGVYRGFKVTLRLVRDTYVHTQDFSIMLVFLDVTPTQNNPQTIAPGGTPQSMITSPVRSSYAANTYDGAINPYRDSYDATLIAALNLASANFGMAGMEYTYQVTQWENIPGAVTQDVTVYSVTVRIGSRVYTTDIIKLIIKFS